VSITGATVVSPADCFWLRYGRRYWSRLLNLFYRRHQQSLPAVQSIREVECVLKQIKWTPDRFGDWIQAPELTWGLKRGDCEDLARLAVELLKRGDIEGWLLSVILKPAGYSHAVCVFLNEGRWFYFSNSKLIETGYRELYNKENYADELSRLVKSKFPTDEYPNINNLVRLIQDKNTLVCWTMENNRGRIVRFGK
jgi:hypothetical protein